MKTRALAAALALCLSVTSALAASPSFSDVPVTHWAYSFVETAAEHGWISGYEDGTFGVDDQITYAQLATMLSRAYYGDELAAYAAPSGAWYASFCDVAEAAGLFVGTLASGAAQEDAVVNQPVTRYELAQIIYNVLTDQGAAVEYDAAAVQAGIADWNAIPSNYHSAVLAANAAGVISSVDSQGTFGGSAPMTRAQAAVVMTRLSQAVSVGSGEEEPTTNEEQKEPIDVFLDSKDHIRFYYVGTTVNADGSYDFNIRVENDSDYTIFVYPRDVQVNGINVTGSFGCTAEPGAEVISSLHVGKDQLDKNEITEVRRFSIMFCGYDKEQSGYSFNTSINKVDVSDELSGSVQTPIKTSGTYVGSVDSDKYHIPGCRFADNILPENEIWFDTKEEAQAAGYSPCGVCQ